MDKNTLHMVGEWAQSRVASGEEPPWTYHKLKLFAEIAQDLASGMDAVTTFGEPPETLAPQNDAGASKVIQMDDFRAVRHNDELQLPS